MQMIKEISEYIEEELEDAEKYAKKALMYEKHDEKLAEMYHELGEQEQQHSLILHSAGVRLIEEYKKDGKTVPPEMQAVYDYLHEKHIEKAKDIKMYLDQYKG